MGLVGHLIQVGQEGLFIHALALDGAGDVHGILEVGDGLDEARHPLLGGGAGQAQGLGDLGVPLVGDEVLILGPGGELGGPLGVVGDDVGQQDGVGPAVGDVVGGAQLVGQGVVDAQKGVGEGHAGDAGGVVHPLPGLLVGAVVVGPLQVLEHHADGVEGQAVGVVGGQHRNIGLDGVGQNIHAGVGGHRLGHRHDELGVHDGHVGGEFVVGQGVLDVVLLVGDDGEGGDLRTGAGGGGDADQLGLFAQFREVVGALADVKELLLHAGKGDIRVLVEHPHPLGGVHGGAAPQGDDDVGLEVVHRLHTPHDGVHRGVGLHLGEDLGVAVDGALSQVPQHLVDVAQLHHRLVGDDKGPADVGHLLQILDGVVFKVDLGRDLEPLHVDPPFGDALDVHQVLGRDVGGGGVFAEGAAAQGEGGGVLVVDVADATLGGGGVDDDAAHLHPLAVLGDDLRVGGVDGGGVAQAAVLEHLGGHLEALLLVLHHDVGQDGGEFLLGEGVVGAHVGDPADEDLGALRDSKTGFFGDPAGGLAHHVGVEGAALGLREGVVDEFLLLLAGDEVAAVLLHDGLEPGGQLLVHDHRLLRGADHAVVKGLGEDEVVAGLLEVGGGVDVAGDVAGAHPQGRLAGGVGGPDHPGAAGGQHQGHVGVVHQGVGGLHGGDLDPLDAVLGGPGGHGGVPDDAGGLGGAVLGAGVEAEDDGAAGLGGDHRLEHGGGGGVGHRGDAGHDAHRLGDLHDACQFVVLDDAHRFLALDVVPDVLGGEEVLDDLILVDAPAGLLHRQLGQAGVVIQPGQGHGVGDFVHLLLGQGHVLLQGGLCPGGKAVDHLLDVDLGCGGSFFLCRHSVSSSFS